MTENNIVFEQKGFHVVHSNIQHIIPKYDGIRYILTSSNDYNIDVLGLCKTFLSESIVDFNFDIPGYQYLRKDRNHKKAGGLLVYIENHVHFKRRQELESKYVESIWIEVCQKKAKSFFVSFVYRPPTQSKIGSHILRLSFKDLNHYTQRSIFSVTLIINTLARKICLNVKHGQNLS